MLFFLKDQILNPLKHPRWNVFAKPLILQVSEYTPEHHLCEYSGYAEKQKVDRHKNLSPRI